MKIEEGKKVTLEYELCVEDGEVIEVVESSTDTGPLEYLHGGGRMLPGLEKRIEGLTVGDEKEGVIPSGEAYGSENALPVKKIARAEFPKDVAPEPGTEFEAHDAGGNPVTFVVVEATDRDVTIRFSHPLAGKDIRFKVKVLHIADPNAKPPPPPQ